MRKTTIVGKTVWGRGDDSHTVEHLKTEIGSERTVLFDGKPLTFIDGYAYFHSRIVPKTSG